MTTNGGNVYGRVSEWTAEQQDGEQGSDVKCSHTRGSRENNFRQNSLKLAWQARPNTGAESGKDLSVCLSV